MNFKQAQSKISSGENTCQDILNYYLGNYKNHNDTYRLIVSLNKTIEKDIKLLDYEKKNGHARSFVHGIPVLISDLIDLKDVPTTIGIKELENNVAIRSAGIVRKLKQNGILIIGKTNTYEISALFSHQNELFLPPLNITLDAKSNAVSMSVFKDISPCGIDIDIEGSVLKSASLLGLSCLKITPNLFNHDGLYIPLKSSSLAIVSHEVLDIAFLLNSIKSETKAMIIYGKNHNYVEDILNEPYNLKIGTLSNDQSLFKSLGLKTRKVSPKLKMKEEISFLSSFVESLDLKVNRPLFSLDSYMNANKLDVIVYEQLEPYLTNSVNPILTITFSYYTKSKTLFLVGKSYGEDKLLTLANFLSKLDF